MHAPNETFDRLLPMSPESEMCLLASLILDPAQAPQVRALIDRGDFIQADHQIIFDSLCSLIDKGGAVDAMLLREDLERRGVLADVGGHAYLADILNSVPSAAHGPHYAAIVREKSVRRGLIACGNDLIRRAYASADEDNTADLAQQAVAALVRLVRSKSGQEAQHLDEILMEVREQMEAGGAPTVTTGFYELDDATSGIALGEMCIVAGRPSMGKSVLAKQMALRAARSGVPSLVISLEEGKHKIGRNILASEAKIDNKLIRKPKFFNAEHWQKIDGAISNLCGTELYVTDRARRMADIHAVASLAVAKHGVKLIAIDYLQRVGGLPGRDRVEKVGAASTAISDMLKELNVAGVVVAQLNRGVEGRDDKRPTMSDIRESGQTEQDADGILFLHREDYYHLDDSDYQPTGIAEVIIGKWRDGERGRTVRLGSSMKYQTFEDLAAWGGEV